MKPLSALCKVFLPRFRQVVATFMVLQLIAGAPAVALADRNDDRDAERSTTTPIKHVILIIGENRSFDHTFGTFVPRHGQSIRNLLSEGIVDPDGTPGPNFSKSAQFTTTVSGTYNISPTPKTAYSPLPPAMTDGAPTTTSDTSAPFKTLAEADAAETDLFSTFEGFLLTGATGLPSKSVDTRIANANNLPNGVFPITPSVAYDAYTGDPVHRFYQMWQQFDCNAAYVTAENPSGCLGDLLPYVETTIGTGNPGKPQPPPNFNQLTTGEGSNAMGIYNSLQGDAPYLTELAQQYAMSDNYHQAVMGGTMVQHLMLGYADLLWYSDGKGTAIAPPAAQIENPNPLAGTNNFYTRDGGGASYSNCSDLSQPGVAPIVIYLQSLPHSVNPNCDLGHFYGLNNTNPQFNADGTLSASATTFAPSNVRHIGDELTEKGISFVYYGGHWDRAAANQPNAYCAICNPFQYANDIMDNAATRAQHIQDAADLHVAIQNGTLPAVAFAKPDGLVDGHPASSKLDLFEGFVKKIVSELQANHELWKETAVFVTFDEGGGYYDSGYIQPLDYFGDGPRIPMIVVSPFSKGGVVSHTYSDHASFVKFVERNWKLQPLTSRSRDNFPNPITSRKDPYVPLNSPAIGDLFDMFHFDHSDSDKD